jgi:Double zinc ribbon
MTHVVEHKRFRYTWELVRHTYIVDLESEIDILQVEISPAGESRLLDPPYPRTSFFEIEIDQIQRNGKTVSSFRNICPVEISRKADWNIMKSVLGSGSSRVTRRFQSQEGETETRWLYTDDLFLISLSSGDRHDLSMLLSLIIQKLNMIALSVQSGRRIRSEFENQQKYRAAMNDMFSEGVDGAFRDVPVYQQHGDMTGSDIDVSAALMSAELQDLMAVCTAEKPGSTESVSAGISREPFPDEDDLSERAAEKPGSTESAPAGISREAPPPDEDVLSERAAEKPGSPASAPAEISGEAPSDEDITAERAGTGPAPAEQIGEVSDPFANIVIKSTFTEAVFGNHVATAEGTVTDSASVADTAVEGIQEESIPEENVPIKDIPVTMSCSSCGAGISGTTKFCGSCGAAAGPASSSESAPVTTSCSGCGAEISRSKKFCGRCGAAVSPAPAAENTPVSSRVTADGCSDTTHSGSRPAAEPVVNLKSIQELDDLSWLND